MVDWDGDGTALEWGFAAVRMESNRVRCSATERLPQADPQSAGRCTVHPVQLLCRALRLAPACYRRFELVAAQPEAPLQIDSSVHLSWAGGVETVQGNGSASFDSVNELKAAMRRFVKEEKLRLVRSPGEHIIVVRRSGDDAESSDDASDHAESLHD